MSMVQKSKNGEKNLTIEIARIVAATLIVIYHYLEGLGSESIFVEGKWSLSFLCELFFIISGFYSFHYVSKISAGMNFKEYYCKRISKIQMVLAASVLIEALLYIVQYWCGVRQEIHFTLLQVVINAVGIQAWGIFDFAAINGPSWYVSVLFLCLIIMYFICRLSDKTRINHQLFFAAMVLLGIVIGYFGVDTVFATRTIARGYISFFLGLLLACNIKQFKDKPIWYYMLICVLPVIFFCVMLSGKVESYSIFEGMYIIFLWSPIVVLLETCFSMQKDSITVIALLGGCTLEVYLFNEPVTVLRNLVMRGATDYLRNPLSMIGFVVFNWIAAIAIHFLQKSISLRHNS